MIVYVSCCPETLARDLAHFTRLGWATSRLEALDMIPQTDEVETVATLERAPLPARPMAGRVRASDIVLVSAHDDTTTLALPPPETGSGLAVSLTRGDKREDFGWSALAIVKGVPRKRGNLRGRGRYVRVGVASGHAIVRVEGSTPAQAASDLAAIGHPVIGDKRRCDEATRRHFFEKHGLDRAAWHTDRIESAGEVAVVAPLPGDLAAVLDSLGISI